MKQKILEYRNGIDSLLANADKETDWNAILKRHLDKIAFFQHERLVHLIVTVLVAILFLMCVGIALLGDILTMLLPALLLLCLLVPYIAHYYLLENEVQKMYDQYDEIVKRNERAE